MKKVNKDLKELYYDKDFQEKYVMLFTIMTFYRNSIKKETFSIPPEFEKFITLTSHGLNLFNRLKEARFSHLDNHQILFSIFLEFYHDELFVDVSKSDPSGLIKLLSTQI